jgi:hypothetical protein
MLRNVWGVLSGLVVLALGVVAVMGLLGPGEAQVESTPIAEPAPASASTVDSAPAPAVPELPGVSSRIAEVLEWNGDSAFAGEDELAQLPPTVAAVLTYYGIPLRIPLTGEEG